MKFYLKDYNLIYEEKTEKYISDEKFTALKEFIKNKKHALGYVNEKYDDFVLMIFPTRHDIIHFEIDYKLKKAVYGVVIKTEEAYEQISENIDDKDTHLDFVKTPLPPVTAVQFEENFKNIYEEDDREIKNLVSMIGTALYEIKF